MPSFPFSRCARLPFASCLMIGLALTVPATAQDAADPLAERLISARGEVEQLNSELELLREEQRSVLAGLSAQRAELSASVDRQQLLAREAEAKLAEAEARASEAGASGDSLVPLLHQAIDALIAQIRGGLPFQVDQRVDALEEIRTQMTAGTLSPSRAVNRLWASFEDEFRLTRENSLHSQTVELAGERVLADVAKIGSMALYFRTQDGRVGQATQAGGEWRFVEITQANQRAQVLALFDALRKQIRVGFFELPMVAGGSR